MIKVAAEYGLSDVAVKKMCRKMNVPTPPRGYWARLAAGHRVKKPVLPKQHDVATARVDPARNAQRREQSHIPDAPGEDCRAAAKRRRASFVRRVTCFCYLYLRDVAPRVSFDGAGPHLRTALNPAG